MKLAELPGHEHRDGAATKAEIRRQIQRRVRRWDALAKYAVVLSPERVEVIGRGDLIGRLTAAALVAEATAATRMKVRPGEILVWLETEASAGLTTWAVNGEAPAAAPRSAGAPSSPHLGRSPDRGGSPDSAGFLRDPADHTIAKDHLEARKVPADPEPTPPAPRPRPRPSSRPQPAVSNTPDFPECCPVGQLADDDAVLVAPRTRVRVERPRYCARPHPKYRDDLAVYRPGVPRGGRVSPS